MKNKQDKRLHEAIRSAGLERPSDNFTAKIMRGLNFRIYSKVYESPIVPRKLKIAFFAVFGVLVLASVAVGIFATVSGSIEFEGLDRLSLFGIRAGDFVLNYSSYLFAGAIGVAGLGALDFALSKPPRNQSS